MIGGRDKMVHALDAGDGSPRWTFRTRGKIDGSPVIAGDRVWVGSASGEIFGLGLESGEALWTFDTGSPVIASPSIAAGKLLIGTSDGQFYCFGG